MPELVAPTTERYDAWRAAHAEWGPGRHEDGFGLSEDDDVSTPAGFATWALGRVLAAAREDGLAEVVVVCAAANPASAAVALHHGGRPVDSGVDDLRRLVVPTS